MVNSGAWITPWIVMTLSLSALLIIIAIVLYCICWRPKNSSPKFYILDESGLHTSSMSEFAKNSISNVRLLSSSGNKENKSEGIFTSKNLQFYKMGKDITYDLDLLDSLDISHSFGTSTLEIDDESLNTTREELHSCISSDSQCTYYTPQPVGRTNSRGTSFSVGYSSDTETLIN